MLPLLLVHWQTVSRSHLELDLDLCPQSGTLTSVTQLQPMSIAMYQARAAGRAVLCRRADEKADDQVREEREARDVVERDSQRMADLRRHKRNWMLRWKTIGEAQKRTVLRLRLLSAPQDDVDMIE